MALAGTIVVGLVLLIAALNGFRRGTIKEGMALVGILLGTLLVMLWGERWGVTVARRTGWQPGTGQWIAAMGLLWVTALLSGYGSGVLLPRRKGRLPTALRGGGALLGLLNGVLLAGFSLRFTQRLLYAETPQALKQTWIRTGVASRFLLDQLDLLVLGLAWGVAVVSLVATLVQLVRRLLAPRPSAPATTSAPAAAKPAEAPLFGGGTTTPSPIAPGMERSFIEKPKSSGGGPG